MVSYLLYHVAFIYHRVIHFSRVLSNAKFLKVAFQDLVAHEIHFGIKNSFELEVSIKIVMYF